MPKRTDQRVRRNKPDVEVDKIEAAGTVEKPDLGIDDPHPFVLEFYESLKDSAQSQYYEPSDWWYARWLCHAINDYMRNDRGKLKSAMMFQNINTAMTDLMVSEGARRRLRLEIERGDSALPDNVIDVADMFAKRFAS